jgi:trans-aconitate methyltransferase
MTSDEIRGADTGYLAFHAPRYAFLLRLLRELGVGKQTRILDIGPSPLTELVQRTFGAAVDTLGFGSERRDASGSHFEFDLNRTQDAASWRRDLPAYDVVVMAEVIEHLHTAPELVLQFVRTLVAPDGVLILQTPNAASLTKRIKLLLGSNPAERLREDVTNPGHYREYTLAELRALAAALCFRVEREVTAYYFDARYAHHESGSARPRPLIGAVKNVAYGLFPKPLREGVTMVWRRK